MDRIFPKSKEMEESTITALKMLNNKATVKDINNKVIEILKLPKEIIELEDENNPCTKFDYEMRKVRNKLKNKGLIINLEKGVWGLK